WIWRRFYANDRTNNSLCTGENLLESGKNPKSDLLRVRQPARDVLRGRSNIPTIRSIVLHCFGRFLAAI
ncbi:hypothetical protein, partial [Caballeronia sp.]|uniref:hypothetical protein n=1 Tax=Caballeronia sp. TaxID=1931223 RepID=UPI002628AAA5